MKNKLLLVITFSFYSIICYSQIPKVGIGTENPDAKLTVHSDTTGIKSVVNYTGDIDLRSIYGYSKPNPGWGYGAEFTGGFVGILGNASADGYTGSAYGIYANASGTAGTRYGLFASASGSGPNNNIGVYGTASNGTNNWAGYFNGRGYFSDSLGVGIENPLEPMHIFGNLRVDSGKIMSWGELTFHPDVDVSGDDVVRFLDAAGGETMRIHSNGYVGIAEDNPLAHLHVGGTNESKVIVSPTTFNSNAELILGEASGLFGMKMLYDGVNDEFKVLEKTTTTITPKTYMVIDRGNGRMSIGKDDPETDLELDVDFSTTSSSSGLQLNAGQRRWKMTVGGSQSPNAAYYQLLYRNHDQTTYNPYLTVTHTGKFGFGTTDIPSGYTMAIAGKLITEGVRVDLEADWPDYVFEIDYAKPTLNQLREFITENKHLPGFHAADKMEKEGIDLEEIAVQQQEWIEVNTLYILEQDEKISKLEKLVQAQAEQIKLLIENR